MAAIEKLMSRKVESRVVEGFEPGHAPQRPHPAQSQQRQPQRHAQQPRGSGQRRSRPEQRRNEPRRPNPQPRHNGQRRPELSPTTTSAYEDQVREARARMAAEGEPIPHRPAAAERQNSQRPGSQRPRRRGRGNGSGRNARPEQWDPRRSEPREPAYAQQHKPNPARPVTVTQKKRTFAGLVGALLGRKPQNEE